VTNPEEYHEIDARGDYDQGSEIHGGFRASFEIPVELCLTEGEHGAVDSLRSHVPLSGGYRSLSMVMALVGEFRSIVRHGNPLCRLRRFSYLRFKSDSAVPARLNCPKHLVCHLARRPRRNLICGPISGQDLRPDLS
jgi:hypothetical protein